MEKSQPPAFIPADNYPYSKPSSLPAFVPSEPSYEPPKYGWCEDTQRNKPQSNTLAAATFIFASGGMSLAWSIGFAPYMDGMLTESTRIHIQICWFVGVILGALVAGLLIDKLTKRIFNFVATGLVLLNGILLIATSDSIAGVTVARYCDGIASGLTIIPAIMAGSEQSVKRFRGLVLSIESIGFGLGLTMKTIFSSFWDVTWSFDANQLHGAVVLVFGAVALLSTFFLTIESPTFYLSRGQEAEAIESLRRLQSPAVVTTETYALLYENKRLLEEDNARSLAENLTRGAVPIMKLFILRILVSMSISYPLSWAYIIATAVVDRANSLWPLYFYGTMRMTGTIVAIFTLDSLGRRIPTGLAMLIAGGLIIGTGSVFSSNYNLLLAGQMESVLGLLMVYQFFAGLVAPAITTYLGEAFSISVKPYFILVAVVAENIVQIIIGSTFDGKRESFASFAMILGSLQIIFGIFVFLAMPETKQTTLREALVQFKRMINIKYN